MKIIKLSIDSLTPDPNNAKEHPDWQIEQIKNSIEQFGNNDPIAVWGEKNIIVEGHGRYEALKELGYTEAECIRLDSLTDEERKAYALAHNKLTMNTEFNLGALELTLDAIEDIDMGLFGFDEVDDEPPAEIVETEIPENVETRCRFGDIWQLGEHRLMCGDSTDTECVDKLMNGKKADISFTSPPYNVGASAKLNGNTHMTDCKYESGEDDIDWWLDLIQSATENSLNNSRWAFINLQMLANNKKDICKYLNNNKDVLCDISIWYKNSTAPAMAERVMNSQFEFIFIFSKENDTRAIGTKNFRGTVSNVYCGSAQRKNEFAEIHSATFPIEFVSFYVENFTKKNDSVLDVFGGTGTTLMAAEQLERKCFMMELDPHYCDVIIKRWEDFTGQKAVLLSE